MELNVDVAVEQFVKRFRENQDKGQVDNSTLYAGSPMYYYCRHCSELTEVLPESHRSAPKTICEPCKVLEAHGLIKDAKAKATAPDKP